MIDCPFDGLVLCHGSPALWRISPSCTGSISGYLQRLAFDDVRVDPQFQIVYRLECNKVNYARRRLSGMVDISPNGQWCCAGCPII